MRDRVGECLQLLVQHLELGVAAIDLGGALGDFALEVGEDIRVLRLKDGRIILTTSTEKFPSSLDSFAVSPDGERLALMTGTELELYVLTKAP